MSDNLLHLAIEAVRDDLGKMIDERVRTVGAEVVAAAVGDWMEANIERVTGPPGPRGDVGPRGFAGPDGAPGVQGPRGERGERGEQGRRGSQGRTGRAAREDVT